MVTSCSAFILYVALSTTPQVSKTWVPNGDFSTQQNCRKAAQELGYTNGQFRCVVK